MKQIIYILTILILTGCGQTNTEQNSNISIETQAEQVLDTTYSDNKETDKQATTDEKETEEYRKQSLSGFEKATLYKLTDTITADFNGDGFLDKVIYKKEIETSGIIIIHGKTNERVKIGFGKQFAHMTEFNWVDYWGLVEDKETSETTFTEDGDVLDSKTVKLKNPSIALGKDEVGGGLITYRNGKYEWIHQTC
ncbi:MAG: hypothetical protein COZ16_05945 [Flavobacteriaceae bacterium CG_4_10_14_3_um_filter_31_253]|nr:MAG: hypothetical protein COW43_08845 [Flavobacteriaceae bacterium CG17_big_fil_post_rev_8_21_14_2_50_31_13]PIX11852.1 MAG: hypothetical protein COZ74_12875 [Flavobacteriaceae bacterium CG_4_8_14_3_um_filter_31_8]PIY15051.1 MAG: hypothetical protein COZ16_05945 [Flavobacteriaceae bacterium CG_4_10_14_3_um_filter_31_253]PIZ12392.1 MAG: hypothetical protein COY55_00015 [Flavobacteriaceae bacterium CG_4_10_14_0_8_um_filter_31_99]PJC10072.1 MAG: hypothetical protein CO067_06505 [Flavobacteriacea